MNKDFYKVLGVGRDVSATEIKSAYRKLALQYHPDKNPDDKEAEEMFKTIASAYDVLGDKDKKAKYDSMGHGAYTRNGSGGQQGFNANDFQDVFNSMRKEKSRQRNKNQYSKAQKMRLTMEEVYHGVTKEFRYDRYDKCNPCNGKGGEDVIRCDKCNGRGTQTTIQNTEYGSMQQTFSCTPCGGRGFKISNTCNTCGGNGIVISSMESSVDIPASTMSNQKIVLRDKGSYYKEDGQDKYGDLVIIIEIIENEFQILPNFGLISQVEIDYPTLVLGGTIEFITIDGTKLSVPVSKFTPIGRKLKLAGKGLKKIGFSHVRGDQYIQVDVKMPETITEKEEELLNELKKIG